MTTTTIDISVELRNGMPTWPDSAGFLLERAMRIEDGHDANVSRLSCDVHVGTHVDAPCHFIEGQPGADRLPLSVLIGPARVVELSGDDVTVEALETSVPPGTERLLLKTKNSALWGRPDVGFRPDFVALTAGAARWVVDNGIRLVGVDYLSVQRYGDGPQTHRTLLGSGVVIVEGLDLRAADAGDYELICLPLRLVGCDGAPARAVLRRQVGC